MNSILNQSGNGLNNLIEQSRLYQALLDIGKEGLPNKIAKHLIGVSFAENTLICQLDDNLWQTQLRFHTPELLDIYQMHFPHLSLNEVEISVLPIGERALPKTVTMEKPSQAASKEMLTLSEKVTSKGLKDILQKLSSRTDTY